MTQSSFEPCSRFLLAADGLRLHYLDYPGGSVGAPVVCIPGLTRPADDFARLAAALALEGRRVLALDYRGRGDSQWDADWTHYTLDVEQDDILRCVADAGVDRAVFVGTSRGGLHTMRLAHSQPGLVRAAVLNDIGPSINLAGLLGIKRYVGKLPPLASMTDAIGLMRLTAGATFSSVSPEEWEIYASHTFVLKDGRIALRYDPELTHTLDEVTPEMVPYDFWEAFEALAQRPVLTLRGENSDLLTPEILAKMASCAPGMEQHIVAGQGHAPLLLDAPTIGRVAEFVRRVA
jgi:pimeloyl-ACP methyl ester carboxylesterase